MFKDDMSNLTQTNRDLLHIPISGNVIVPEWLNHLRFDGGKVCLNAAAILGDVVYWYRPREVRDEMSGATIGYERRTNNELLQRNYSQYEKLYGLTNKQVRTAVKVLRSAQVIWTETRNIRTPSGAILNNVMYIGLYTGRLYEITVPSELHDPDILAGLSHPTPPKQPDRPPGLSVTGPPSRARQTALQGAADRPPGQTYTETTYSTTYKSSAVQSDNARKDTSVEVNPTNQPSSDARGDPPDAETNNGWLVGSSFLEAAEFENLKLNSTETAQQIADLLTHPSVCVSDATTIRRLSAAGALEHVFRHVAHWWALPGEKGAGLLVWRIRENMPLPDGLPDGFARTDVFEQHAPESIRAACAVEVDAGYQIPAEYADLVVG